jgi:hypothetical protein
MISETLYNACQRKLRSDEPGDWYAAYQAAMKARAMLTGLKSERRWREVAEQAALRIAVHSLEAEDRGVREWAQQVVGGAGEAVAVPWALPDVGV